MAIFEYFQRALWVQLFYAFAVTLLVYGMSSFTTLNYVEVFTDNVGTDIQGIGDEINENFENQVNVPLVDLGSLVFFSGNIIVDLIINFVTALPNMVNILISGFFLLVPVEAQIQTQVKLFIVVSLTIMYVLGTIALLADIRGGRALA